MSAPDRAASRQAGAEYHELLLPLAEIDASMLPLVGGKAANLGELVRAGFPVPPGCCLTTHAYAEVAGRAGLEPILTALSETALSEPALDVESPGDSQLAEHAATARERLLAAPVPDRVVEAVAAGYAALGDGEPVAVRSSATAEDLPFASFAGQQDTYLGVIGTDAVLDAVRRCWASLWTDRAVSYRARNGVDHRAARLAVVVQRMVEARTAGVMFTANPLSGRRRQAVIDASPGLGEAVVSGAVNPDHFVVDPADGEVLERHLGDKRVLIRAAGGGTERVEQADGTAAACVDDRELAALATLGARVEDHYATPQDIEWAIDADGITWLTQARPITTLYPLPPGAPAPDDALRVYFSVNVAQGVLGPLTPAGLAAFRMVGSSGAAEFGLPPQRPSDGPPFMVAAGDRLFFDLTTAIRSRFGRLLLPRLLGMMETRSGRVLDRLVEDPRLSVVHRSVRPVARRVVPALLRHRTPLRAAATLLNPATARRRMGRLERRIREIIRVPEDATAAQRLSAVESALSVIGPAAPGTFAPVLLPYAALHILVRRLLGHRATEQELQIVLRGLPGNKTTEMDLELWRITSELGRDPEARQLFLQTPPARLAGMYRDGVLPPAVQCALAGFLRTYGHRGVAEIDVGVARWAEEPSHILGAVANYLRLEDPGLVPGVKFERGRREGEAMVAELTDRVRGRVRGRLVGFCLRRIREIGGLRESPKFNLVLLFAGVRDQLREVGAELTARGLLASAGDVFFVDTVEARQGLAGRDLRKLVAARRASYEREQRRRHVPRMLLSDGTEPEAALLATAAGGGLTGTPASPGQVTAAARVVLDPAAAHLEPGEILVAPSTDPGWTPLFLTAGGLVMEMGGAMSHGAVVAREYGIPAVVGVAHATGRIGSGRLVTVDGSAGTVRTPSP